MDSPSAFQAALQAAFQSALGHLESLRDRPVAATVSLSELRAKLAKPLNDHGLAPEEVVRDLVDDTQGGLLGSAGGRFFAWAIGGSLPAALAADWLTAAWDQNAALFACAPSAAVVEEVTGAWLKDLLAIPASASFAFVSGCQMAHTTCLAAARHALLQERGWDVERNGLCGAPPIRVLASNRHGSIERTIRLLGIGEGNVCDLAVDDREQTTPAVLEAALASAPGAATIVVLQAGDLNSGSFDNYHALIPIARRHRAWVHVDGAFGLWAGASPRYRHLVEGVELADSWATDGHKWLNVPYDSGYAFVARPEAHRAAMSHRAPYLVHDQDARDQIDWNPEWSRRARGFATYAAIRQLGRIGVADLIDRCCEHARTLVEGIGHLDGAEVLWRSQINQGLVRFRDPRLGAGEEDHDRFTDAAIARVLEGGEAFFAGTNWHGRRAMRVSVLNWQTSPADVARAIAAF
ncbi:Pyridoxal-dependent decarboxylase [Candidatus Sulfopaludibacter sp. SbA3]|nr:Pyridoxal-dependent decarboxylase [Candidatus Sulfopaludibacter sp. SbA3]